MELKVHIGLVDSTDPTRLDGAKIRGEKKDEKKKLFASPRLLFAKVTMPVIVTDSPHELVGSRVQKKMT